MEVSVWAVQMEVRDEKSKLLDIACDQQSEIKIMLKCCRAKILSKCAVSNNLIVRRRNLSWCGYGSRHDTVARTIHQGTVKGTRWEGRQCKVWLANSKE